MQQLHMAGERMYLQPMKHISSPCTVIATLLLIVMMVPATASPLSRKDARQLERMAGQMLMIGFRGYDVNANSPIMLDIRKRHLGGVILFDYDVALHKPERNIKSPQQVARLTQTLRDAAEVPLLVAVDQEGGRVQRLKARYGFTQTPSAQAIGATGDTRQALLAGEKIGAMLRGAGFNLDFAPVVDVNENPASPAIGAIGRSFSYRPDRVAAFAGEFINGLHAHGVLSCIKHFPGHGSAGSDSHLGVTDVTDTWKPEELIPYRTLITQKRVDMIMTAHIFNAKLDPDHPATLSSRVIDGLLRKQLGWQGVVVTDDLNMKAISTQYGFRETIRLAIAAGADILLFGNNLSYDPHVVAKAVAVVRSLVEEGSVSMKRIRESYGRIMELKKNLIK